MKTLISTLLLAILMITPLSGQECADFLYMQEGKSFTSKNYDKKGKLESISKCTVSKVSQSGTNLEASMVVHVTDPKGTDLMDMGYIVSCDGKDLFFDMTTMMNQETLAGFGELEMSTTTDLLRMPPNMAVGDKLPDGHVDVSMAEGAMNVSVQIIEREVLAVEPITVGGKSFDCYKISYANVTNMGFIKIRLQVIEWWSKDLLMVKSETYNKKGKLMSSTVMELIE